MNQIITNITLGIILVIILVVGLWNPTLLETMSDIRIPKPIPKPPTPTEQLNALNAELMKVVDNKKDDSVIGLQKFKLNIIAMLEQKILQNMIPTEGMKTRSDIISHLLSPAFLPYITVYNGLRAMPYRPLD